MPYDIHDLSLAERGQQRIAWAARHMPVLGQISDEFAQEQPFQGKRIAASLHITTETTVLLSALQAGGAEIALCASNPFSTRDDVCAALVARGMSVFAIYGEDLSTYQRHLEQTLANAPHLVMDDGADLIVAALRDFSTREVQVREHLTEFHLPNGRVLYLLAQGRLVGQVAAEASPAAVMDLSFADQALSTRYLLKTSQSLPPAVYDVPSDIDERVAALKLRSLGVRLDELNEDQRSYQNSWKSGTV